MDAARDAFGRLDIVVNNVGGSMPRPFMDTTTGYLERAFHFNVATAHALTRAAVPAMLRGGGGAVVNVSSVVGRVTGRGYLAYGTAKAALAHYTRLVARDLAPRSVSTPSPSARWRPQRSKLVLNDDAMRSAMEQATPLKRIGEPGDIAAAVLFLCAPSGADLTGKVLEADGGLEGPNLDMGLPDL